MNKAKIFHALHTFFTIAAGVAPFLIPAVRDAIAHSPSASAGLMSFYVLLGKLIPKA